MQKPVIIIPAYQPDEDLVKLVGELTQDHEQMILIVDDGSTGASRELIDSIDTHAGQVKIIHHPVNLGKGQALKTGFNSFLAAYGDDCVGVVTADADGQHGITDILRVASTLQDHPQALCLGIRKFEENTPLQRSIGNRLTILVFKLITGVRVMDTQTGLRGIPTEFLPDLLHLTESGYDFELDMLILAAKSKYQFIEIPIQTIYHPQNKGSHYKYLRDSLKIYSVFIRSALSSKQMR